MRTTPAAILAALLAWPVLAADGQAQQQKTPVIPATPLIAPGQDPGKTQARPTANPDTPSGKYQELVKEYQNDQREFTRAYRAAKTPEERRKLLSERQSRQNEYPAKFIELARKYPTDPVAVDALLWVVANMPMAHPRINAKGKALAMLLGEHVTSARLEPLCLRLASDIQDPEAETLLRAILAKNPSAQVRGSACLALAMLMAQKADVATDLKDENTAKQLERFYGKELITDLKKSGPAKLTAASEDLFKTFVDKYLSQTSPDSLSNLAQRLAFTSNKGSALVLRRIADDRSLKAKPETRARACMALARMLQQRADGLPDAQLKEADALYKESVGFCERVISEYADVRDFRGTLGDKAKKQLYELRFLSKGKTAPEVEGEDLDGKSFKLSDYRGKVVLLDFWGNW